MFLNDPDAEVTKERVVETLTFSPAFRLGLHMAKIAQKVPHWDELEKTYRNWYHERQVYQDFIETAIESDMLTEWDYIDDFNYLWRCTVRPDPINFGEDEDEPWLMWEWSHCDGWVATMEH